jgi:hypothetical protein
MQSTDGAPRRKTEAFEVLEVDLVTGRPRLCRRYDFETNKSGLVEFRDGYRAPGGAVHEYDPLARLRRKDD